MSLLEKPTRRPNTSESDAVRLLEQFQKLSTDHALTLSNEALCERAAQAWPIVDLVLLDIQREMSRPTATEEASNQMNHLMQAFWQIRNRFLTYAERGNDLIHQKADPSKLR